MLWYNVLPLNAVNTKTGVCLERISITTTESPTILQ